MLAIPTLREQTSSLAAEWPTSDRSGFTLRRTDGPSLKTGNLPRTWYRRVFRPRADQARRRRREAAWKQAHRYDQKWHVWKAADDTTRSDHETPNERIVALLVSSAPSRVALGPHGHYCLFANRARPPLSSPVERLADASSHFLARRARMSNREEWPQPSSYCLTRLTLRAFSAVRPCAPDAPPMRAANSRRRCRRSHGRVPADACACPTNEINS